jgi:hypothetical protein
MPEKIFVDWDYSLAVVKFKENWRFFYDIESMFLLDYHSFHNAYNPVEGEFRYGTLIVDKNNAEQWMSSITREVTLEQIPNLYWENTETRVKLTFLINFDERLWVGSQWKMDQSPLHEYQPQGWTAREDNVLDYLPPELKGNFV